MNTEIRQLQDSLLDVLNSSNAPLEAKRILLCLLAKDCELKSNALIQQEMNETITEKGEMENVTELDKGTR